MLAHSHASRPPLQGRPDNCRPPVTHYVGARPRVRLPRSSGHCRLSRKARNLLCVARPRACVNMQLLLNVGLLLTAHCSPLVAYCHGQGSISPQAPRRSKSADLDNSRSVDASRCCNPQCVSHGDDSRLRAACSLPRQTPTRIACRVRPATWWGGEDTRPACACGRPYSDSFASLRTCSL